MYQAEMDQANLTSRQHASPQSYCSLKQVVKGTLFHSPKGVDAEVEPPQQLLPGLQSWGPLLLS